MIYDTIKNFNTQFLYEPRLENADQLKSFSRVIVCGMGGSNHATALLKMLRPERDIIVHRNYGLPALSEEMLKKSLVICSSYSGNTEEVLDGFKVAGEQGLARVAVSIGGKLLEQAQQEHAPYVQMPDMGIQPRSAVGFSFRSLARCMGDEEMLQKSATCADSLDPSRYEEEGRALAKKMHGFIPVIYSSALNEALAYNWKIRFNETAKIPAFVNVFPELNHNEMNGFDVQEQTGDLSKNMYFIFLKDPESDPRVLKRMQVTEKLLVDRGLPVEIIELQGASMLDKIFSSIILADWTSYYSAKEYGIDSEEVPMVEEFKGLIQK